MRQFHWRLDRILEIKMKEEQIKQAVLAETTYHLAQVRVQLLRRQQILAGLLKDIRKKPANEKLDSQKIFLENSKANDDEIRQIQKKVQQLQQQEAEKTSELIDIKRYIKKLQKIRQKACDAFLVEQRKLQQNELDENFGIRVARHRCGQFETAVKGEL